jgi:hypothetical protein
VFLGLALMPPILPNRGFLVCLRATWVFDRVSGRLFVFSFHLWIRLDKRSSKPVLKPKREDFLWVIFVFVWVKMVKVMPQCVWVENWVF